MARQVRAGVRRSDSGLRAFHDMTMREIDSYPMTVINVFDDDLVAAVDEALRRIERYLRDWAQQRLNSLRVKLEMTESSVPAELDHLKPNYQIADYLSAYRHRVDVPRECRDLGVHAAHACVAVESVDTRKWRK